MKIILSILISRMDDRGGDSWGYYLDGKISKGIGTGVFGADLDDISSGQTLMLHTRKATVGEKTVENAHPWKINNLIGMHNGGVGNHKAIQFQRNRNFNVDSQHIFAHISEDLPLTELQAHGTIVFVDTAQSMQQLWCCRFNAGVLTIVGIGADRNNPTDVIFCSLGDPIKSALDMAKVPMYESFKVDDGKLYYITDGNLKYPYPTVELPFGARSANTNNYGRNWNCLDYNGCDNLYTELEERDNIRDSVQHFQERIATKKTGPVNISRSTEIEIKTFVRSRTGLEAWYKSGECSWCGENQAGVRAPSTNLLYCLPCWARIETFAPYMLDINQHELFFSTDDSRPPWETSSEGTDDENEQDKACEDCETELAVWYASSIDMAICNECKKERGYSIKELISLTEKAIIQQKQSKEDEPPVLDIMNPKRTGPCQCEDKCPLSGRVFYFVEHLKKHLHLSHQCFTRLYDIDLEKQKKRISINRINRTSAYNPDKTRPIPLLGTGQEGIVH